MTEIHYLPNYDGKHHSLKKGRSSDMTARRHLRTTAVLVLGMHRSGTSAVAGVLQRVGVELGHELMPPLPDNPKGCFEDTRIVGLHDEVLSAFDTSWDDPQFLPERWDRDPRLVPFRQRLDTMLRADFIDTPLWGVTDPRLCRLVPFWTPVLRELEVNAKALIVVRDPSEVAASLHKRDRLAADHAAILWLSHMLALERDTRDVPRTIILYDDLLRDWISEVRRVSATLHIDLFLLSPSIKGEVDDFIEGEFKRHQNPTAPSLRASQSSWVSIVYEAMLRWRRESISPTPVCDQAAEALAASELATEPIAMFLRSRANAAVLAVRGEVAQREAEVAQRDVELAKRDAELEAARQATKRNEELLAAVSTRMSESERENAELRSRIAEAEARATEFEVLIGRVRSEQARLQHEMDKLLNSTIWRLTDPVRKATSFLPLGIKRQGRRTAKAAYWILTPHRTRARIAFLRARRDGIRREPPSEGSTSVAPSSTEQESDYDRWVGMQDNLTDTDRNLILRHVASLENPPRISVVMPVYNTDEKFLREAIQSVRAQLYPNWELCIADDCSPLPHVPRIIEQIAEIEPRVRWIRRKENGNISIASNSALELATGDFVALMDHDDLLSETALYEVAVAICSNPKVDILYSDQDSVDDSGRRFDPFFKPKWNEELFLGQNMISHLGVYRRMLLSEVGGFRAGFEGSQDYDLALRCILRTDRSRIQHIPKVLYHWRKAESQNSFSATQIDRCVANARRAIAEFLAAKGVHGAEVQPAPLAPNWTRVRLPISDPAPLVTVIIPLRDNVDLLRRCLAGVLHRTRYSNLEVLIVDNESVEPGTHHYLLDARRDERVGIVKVPGPFNYSAINNAAVKLARGPIIAFLNNGSDVISEDWLSEMVSLALKPDVGCVGAKLLYNNDTIQHAGVILGAGELAVAGHIGTGLSRHDVGYIGRCALVTEVSAVTAACAVVRREVFDAVGGFDEINLPVAFSDVDLCLRVRERGWRNLWTPFAELYHLETASRGSDSDLAKIEHFRRACRYMRDRWGEVLDNDPFYHQVFDRRHSMYHLGNSGIRKTWMMAEANRRCN